MNAAFAIMAALYFREHTGEGQFIDIALLDSIMPLMGWVAANLLIGGQQPVLLGNDNFTAAPSGMFRTQDGYINIAANQQQQWEDLADELGLPELKTDSRFQPGRRPGLRAGQAPPGDRRCTTARHREHQDFQHDSQIFKNAGADQDPASRAIGTHQGDPG